MSRSSLAKREGDKHLGRGRSLCQSPVLEGAGPCVCGQSTEVGEKQGQTVAWGPHSKENRKPWTGFQQELS